MRQLVAALALLAWGGPLAADCARPVGDDAPVVLFLDITGEGAPRTPPLLAVHANGAVTARSEDGPRQSRFTPDGLDDLLDFVTAQGFATLDAQALDASLGGLPIGDAQVSYIGLDLPGCDNLVAVEGSVMKMFTHPSNKALGIFRRIEVRLLDTLTAVQTGLPLP